MWAIGSVWYFPDKPHLDFTLSVDDVEGYPLEKYLQIEKEYVKKRKAKNPNYQERLKKQNPDTNRFVDHPDRPVRYRD